MFVREAGSSLMLVAFVLKVLFVVFLSLCSIIVDIYIYAYINAYIYMYARSNNMSRIKVHMKGRQRSESKIRKLIMIKIQVLPTGTPSLVGKASALEKPRTWVRVLASVIFFICSVASFFLCCPCEALEGPISTMVCII